MLFSRATSPLLKRVGTRIRQASNKTAKHPFSLRMDNQNNFRQGFLQDPSVYPLIAILGAGLTFMCAMGAHALTSYKDVQVDPTKRNQMMQTWGRQEEDSLTKRWTRRSTKRMNLQEGMGIDHNEWTKHKKDHQHYQPEGQGEQ